ncbi:MAG: hypothetical protein AAGA95_21170, partial [Pseudomonadota bacterium]
ALQGVFLLLSRRRTPQDRYDHIAEVCSLQTDSVARIELVWRIRDQEHLRLAHGYPSFRRSLQRVH